MLLGFLLTLQQGELWRDLAWQTTKKLGIPWYVDYTAGILQIILSFGRWHMLLSMAFHFVVDTCKQYQLSLAHPVWKQKFGSCGTDSKPEDHRTFALIPAIVKEENSCRSIWRRLEWTRRCLKTLKCAMTPETGDNRSPRFTARPSRDISKSCARCTISESWIESLKIWQSLTPKMASLPQPE